MNIIAIANQKGGCGKTTTAINLAAGLGKKGKNTLLVDLDPQGHASLGLGVHSADIPGLYEVFTHEISIDQAIVPAVAEGVDLVPASISLAVVERLFADDDRREWKLTQLLEPCDAQYDYAVIDCPPTLSFLSFNALMAADQVVIPIEMSLFALDGIDRICDTIAMLSEKYRLQIPIRVVPTLVDNRTRLSRKFLRDIWERFADEISPVMVPYTVRLKEAVCNGKSIIDYDPESPAALQYLRLADEIIHGLHIVPNINEVVAPKRKTTDNVLAKQSPISRKSVDNQKVVLNFLNYRADEVQIAGDFNDWIPDRNVETRINDNVTQKVLYIPPGVYEYRVVINGRWLEDLACPERMPNDMGEFNSVLRVVAAQPEPAHV